MVRVSSFKAFNRVMRPFFCGRKPSKQKRSSGRPEETNAGTKAVAPGRHCTSMPFLTHSRTTRKPGSDMPGVPASEIKATVCPPLMRLTILSTVGVRNAGRPGVRHQGGIASRGDRPGNHFDRGVLVELVV